MGVLPFLPDSVFIKRNGGREIEKQQKQKVSLSVADSGHAGTAHGSIGIGSV